MATLSGLNQTYSHVPQTTGGASAQQSVLLPSASLFTSPFTSDGVQRAHVYEGVPPPAEGPASSESWTNLVLGLEASPLGTFLSADEPLPLSSALSRLLSDGFFFLLRFFLEGERPAEKSSVVLSRGSSADVERRSSSSSSSSSGARSSSSS